LGVIKVDDDVCQKLNEVAQKSGKSVKDLATQAIKLFLEGTNQDIVDAEIEDIKRTWIKLKFPGKCSGCGKPLKPGDEAYYIKYVYKDNKVPPKPILYCVTCYFDKVETDELLAKRYAKLRELERIVKYYERKARELSALQTLDEITNYFIHAREVISNLISKKSFSNEDIKPLEEIYNQIELLAKSLSDIKFKARELARKAYPKYSRY
jgi:hypothetical protein